MKNNSIKMSFCAEWDSGFHWLQKCRRRDGGYWGAVWRRRKHIRCFGTAIRNATHARYNHRRGFGTRSSQQINHNVKHIHPNPHTRRVRGSKPHGFNKRHMASKFIQLYYRHHTKPRTQSFGKRTGGTKLARRVNLTA